jgi:AcrR family transcriptional regulator
VVAKAEVGKPRLRRTSQEIRGLLHAAASSYFAQNGYAGTSTRAIATEAGVSETLLFRHFGNKSGLFEATTLERFRASIDEFVARWDKRRVPAGGEEAHARVFMHSLIRLLRSQRAIMLALLTLDSDDSDVESIQATALESFDQLLVLIRTHALSHADGSLYPGIDAELTPPAVAGVVLAVTLLDQWLFQPGADRPTVSAVDQEVITYVLHGVGRR